MISVERRVALHQDAKVNAMFVDSSDRACEVVQTFAGCSLECPPNDKGGKLKAVLAPVLVVEDDTSIREGMAEVLEADGFAVATAVDGRAALEQLQKGLRPFLILLDLMMPGMDGWDFRTEQAKDPSLRGIATVVLTGSGFESATLGKQLGGVEVFQKPVTAHDLLAMVRRLSARAR